MRNTYFRGERAGRRMWDPLGKQWEAKALGAEPREDDATWDLGASRMGPDPCSASREEGGHGQMENVPLIFLGVIRLTEVTEHHAYSFFSLPLSHNP